tara:strand:+ start:7299 stop:9230 length:1932 start_codon:yes stop_codon:yes gene_type:complete
MKKLLLLTVLLTYSATMFSQLFVRPNPSSSTDSYVYVKDEILFVEQDVNLEINSAGDTQASLYLRDGAQLIQGDSNTPNKGSGQLSVYQNAPHSDQWTYNYWCSPIGNPLYLGTGVDGNKNMSIRILYDIQNLTLSNLTIRTNDRDGSSSPLTISKRWIYTKLRGLEAESDYQRVGDTHYIPAGFGFTMKGVDLTPVDINGNGTQDPEDGFKYDFRGRPNNGDITINVFAGESTLSGNPYPSALDLNRLFYDTDSGDSNGTVNFENDEISEFYYWDENKDSNSHYYAENEGGYGTYTPGPSNPNGISTDGDFEAGTYTPPTFTVWNAGGGSNTGSGASGALYERRFAPIGQGFLFFAGSDGPVIIKNKYRRHIKEGDNSDFRRPGVRIDPVDPVDPDPVSTKSQLRINTAFGNQVGISHIRQMVLAFSDQSTVGYDRGLDGRHPMDAVGADVYFPVNFQGESTPFVISTVPFSIDRIVPVDFIINTPTPKIKITIVENVNFNETAYFYDHHEDTYQEITNDNEASFGLEVGEHKNRFAILFQSRRQALENSEGTIAKEETRANVDFFQNNPSKQLEIRNPEGYDIKTAMVYDMAGKLVISKSNLGANNIITLSTSNVTDGIYLVQLLTSDNINIDHKMIIKNN